VFGNNAQLFDGMNQKAGCTNRPRTCRATWWGRGTGRRWPRHRARPNAPVISANCVHSPQIDGPRDEEDPVNGAFAPAPTSEGGPNVTDGGWSASSEGTEPQTGHAVTGQR